MGLIVVGEGEGGLIHCHHGFLIVVWGGDLGKTLWNSGFLIMVVGELSKTMLYGYDASVKDTMYTH